MRRNRTEQKTGLAKVAMHEWRTVAYYVSKNGQVAGVDPGHSVWDIYASRCSHLALANALKLQLTPSSNPALAHVLLFSVLVFDRWLLGRNTQTPLTTPPVHLREYASRRTPFN